MKICIVQTTCKDMIEAKKIANILIEKKLAACVQITDIESVYVWDNKICNDSEKLLCIKTKIKHFKKIKRKIKENHSYDLPEIIQINIDNASKEYLKFIKGNTK